MNLRSSGPVAGQTITVKVKCRIPFSEFMRDLRCLSDLQLSREIFPVSESQCELISISKSYELMVLVLCVLSNVG